MDLAQRAEQHGWGGALIGTGWGRPDTFTVATAVAARTTTFTPLVAIRPGYWHPAHFASAAATLDQLSEAGCSSISSAAPTISQPTVTASSTIPPLRPHTGVLAVGAPAVERGRCHPPR